MKILQKVEKQYGELNTEWVIEKGKTKEVRLIKELALALKQSESHKRNAQCWESSISSLRVKRDIMQREIDNLVKVTAEYVRHRVSRIIADQLIAGGSLLDTDQLITAVVAQMREEFGESK